MASFAYRRCKAEMQELREIGETLLAIRSRPLLKLRLWQYVGRLRSRVSAIAYRSRPASPSQQRLHCASAGQLLQAAAKSGEKHRRQTRHDSGIETLADSGVSEKQSVEWQKLTKAPDAEFEAALADRTAAQPTRGDDGLPSADRLPGLCTPGGTTHRSQLRVSCRAKPPKTYVSAGAL
jgi:hypothetical protein